MRRPGVRTLLVAALAGYLALVPVGCASRPRHTGKDLAAQRERPARGVLAASEILRSGPRTLEYFSPELESVLLRVTIDTALDGRTFTIKREKIAGEPGAEPRPVTEQVGEWGMDGSLSISREINHEEDVLVEFNPALVIVPALVDAANPFTQTLTMTVRPLADQTRTRAKGQVTQQIAYAATALLRLPAGTLHAARMQATFDADLSGTKVHNETSLWLTMGTGVVAEERGERTMLLGVPFRQRHELWVLRSSPGAMVTSAE